MKTLELAGWKVEVDEKQTQTTYSLIEKGGCEQCGCASCRNFLLIAQSALPKEMTNFIYSSNIDINKDAEIYDFGTSENKLVLYAGEYYFWGKIVEKPMSNHGIIQETDIQFVKPTPLAQKEFQSPNAIGLFFHTVLPWVLDEPLPRQ